MESKFFSGAKFKETGVRLSRAASSPVSFSLEKKPNPANYQTEEDYLDEYAVWKTARTNRREEKGEENGK